MARFSTWRRHTFQLTLSPGVPTYQLVSFPVATDGWTLTRIIGNAYFDYQPDATAAGRSEFWVGMNTGSDASPDPRDPNANAPEDWKWWHYHVLTTRPDSSVAGQPFGPTADRVSFDVHGQTLFAFGSDPGKQLRIGAAVQVVLPAGGAWNVFLGMSLLYLQPAS